MKNEGVPRKLSQDGVRLPQLSSNVMCNREEWTYSMADLEFKRKKNYDIK